MPPIDDGQLLNTVLASLTTAIQQYYPLLLIYAERLMSVIVLFQIGWIFCDIAGSHDLTRLFDDLVLGFIRIGIVYLVLMHVSEWGYSIINTGIQIGSDVSGQSPSVLTPSGIVTMGMGMYQQIMVASAEAGWLHPIIQATYEICAIIVALLWAAAGLIYLLVLLEAAWVIYVGPILIAFSTLTATGSMLVQWFTELLALAIKIAVLLMLLAVFMIIAQGWKLTLTAVSTSVIPGGITSLAGSGGTYNIITDNVWLVLTLIQAILFFGLVLKLPNRVVSIVGATLMGLGEAAVGTAISTGVSGGAAAATGGASLAAQGAKAGASAISKIGSTSRLEILS